MEKRKHSAVEVLATYLMFAWIGWMAATQHYHVEDTKAQSEWLRSHLTTLEEREAWHKTHHRICR